MSGGFEHSRLLAGKSCRFNQTLRECLTTAGETSQDQKIYILTGLMACPFFQKPENSVRILGVIDFQRRQLESPIDPLRKRYYYTAKKAARAVMGDAAFESASAEAAKLSLDDALDLMLQKVEEL